MINCEIYFHTDLTIQACAQLLAPVIEPIVCSLWRRYYRQDIDFFYYTTGKEKFLLTISENTSYHKSEFDSDRFNKSSIYIDWIGEYTDQENMDNIIGILKILWTNNIPTCVPGWGEMLPYEGGALGPVLWPNQ